MLMLKCDVMVNIDHNSQYPCAPHTPRSNGSRCSLLSPVSAWPRPVARISHSPTTAWAGLAWAGHLTRTDR